MNNHDDQQTNDVLQQLSVLEPNALEKPKPARQAYAELQQRLQPEPAPSPFVVFTRWLFAPTRRTATAVFTLLLLFSLSLFSPTVRAAAADFLALFRVEQFAAISISPERLALLQQIAEQGMTPGTFEILEEPSEPASLPSLAAAQETAAFPLRSLPLLGEPTEVLYAAGGSGRLLLDVENARAILEAVEADPTLIPDSVEGQPITVQTYDMVHLGWDDTMLMQAIAPDVSYPVELQSHLLGQAVLEVLGTPPNEAARLAQEIDWTSTLLLPIPTDFATFSEVMVDGSNGVALEGIEGNALLWQKEGIVYILLGSQPTEELITLAGLLE